MSVNASTTVSAPSLSRVKQYFSSDTTQLLIAMVKVARLLVETERERVDAIMNAELNDPSKGWHFMTDNKIDRERGRVELIKDHKRLYLSEDSEQLERWDTRRDELIAANGWEVEPGYCPALMAKTDMHDAHRALREHFELFMFGRHLPVTMHEESLKLAMGDN